MVEIFTEFENLNQEDLYTKLYQIEDVVSNLEMFIQDEEAKSNRYKVKLIKIIFSRLKMKEGNIIIFP